MSNTNLNLRNRCFGLLLVSLIFAGCGTNEGQKEIEFASATVQHALETWQQGGTPAKLLEEPVPVKFYDDDWERSAKLIDFEIRQTYMESDGTARCAVTLTVKYGKKKPVIVKCAYQIVTDPEVIVGRDPMA
jgi:hypothetical protein